MVPSTNGTLRWRLAAQDEAGALFADERALGRHVGKGAYAGMEFLHVNARSIINSVPASSRMPFRHTINAYRGCSHACVYCFARPSHEYLGLGIGEDFDRRIVVKINASERLRAELRSSHWSKEPIAMGTNTDPYQHAEGKYHLTRGIVEVLSERQNPFSILTKSTLVLRDLKILANASLRTEVRVNLSIGTLDADVARLCEPGTPLPQQRLDAVRRLNAAGVPTGVLIAPVMPGLSDGTEQLRALTIACAEAGAVSVHPLGLHLRSGVRDHFFAWLRTARPDLVDLYAERFDGRAYQPSAVQQRVQDVVVQSWRACTGDRSRLTAPPSPAAKPADADSGESRPGVGAQLALFSDDGEEASTNRNHRGGRGQ